MQWPTRCLLCHGWGLQAVCGLCRLRLAPGARDRARCGGCGALLALGVTRCSDCVRLPPPQAGTVVAVDYTHPWDRLLLEFKYGARPELAAALASLLAEAVRQADAMAAEAQRMTTEAVEAGPGAPSRPGASPVDLVVPIPLSPGRLRQRGYNQAWEIARRVARQCGLRSRADALQRWVELPQQALHDRQARLHRLRGVFGVPVPALAHVAGQHVAVVDDVYTTGATAAEAVRTLQAAGAARVSVWAVARTPAVVEGAS